MGFIWTPNAGGSGTSLQAWPAGSGKAMTQYSAGTYNAGNPNAAGCAGHNQILSALDSAWNGNLSAFGFGTSSGVAHAVSGNKQSPSALVAGIKAYFTNLGMSFKVPAGLPSIWDAWAIGATPGVFANNAAGTRAPIILIKQMRQAIDNALLPNSYLANVYGGYASRTWNGSGVPTDGYTASSGKCALSYSNGHKGGHIYRLWMQIDVSGLAGWTGPLWYYIGGIAAVAAYGCAWYVQDGAPTPAFTSAQYGTQVESNLFLASTSPNVYIPLGIYPTIGSSGTITVCANFYNDTGLVDGSITTGPTINTTQQCNSAEPAYFS